MNVIFHKITSYTINFQNFIFVFSILVKFDIPFLRLPWEFPLVLLHNAHLEKALSPCG